MPDAISVYTVDGIDYLITANEGDSRDWNGYSNEIEVNFGKGKTSPTGKITADNSGLTGKVTFFDTSDYDGLNNENDYLFGEDHQQFLKLMSSHYKKFIQQEMILKSKLQHICQIILTVLMMMLQ